MNLRKWGSFKEAGKEKERPCRLKGRAALLTPENSLQNSWNPDFLMYCCCRIEPKLVGIGSLLAHCGFRVSNFTWSLEYQSPQSISSQKVLISRPSGWHSREFRSSHSQKPAKEVSGASHCGTAVSASPHEILLTFVSRRYQEWLGWRFGYFLNSDLWVTLGVTPRFCKGWRLTCCLV